MKKNHLLAYLLGLALSPALAVDLNDASRYTFITDASKPTLAVVDALERKVLAPIALKTPATVIDISKKGGFIAYAKRGERGFYRLDLATQQQRQLMTEWPITALVLHESGKWLAYSGTLGAAVVNVKTGTEQPIATEGTVSLLFHTTAAQLFVAELDKGRLQRLDLATGKAETLFELGRPMSPISVMPNGMALFFVADGRLQRYSLLDEALTPIAQNSKLAPLRPYMSSDSRLILALSAEKSTELLAISAYTYKVNHRYALADWQLTGLNHDFMMTGWLEKVAVLADDNGLFSLAFSKPDSLKRQPNQAGVRDMLVQSDSKTLLLTRKGSKQLGVFDMRNQVISDEITLPIEQPADIVMGETNTLCH